MPKKAPWPPQAKPHNGKMRCWHRGRWWHLGKETDEPGWKARLARYVNLWTIDPNAADLRADALTVVRLFRDYLASPDSPEKKTSQRARYVTTIELLADHHSADVLGFGPQEFRAWVRSLCTLKNAQLEHRFNRTSVKHFMGCVRRVWKWGVENREIPPEKLAAIRTVAPPKRGECREPNKAKLPAPEIVEKVIPHLPPVPRAVIQLLRRSAARPSEILVLCPEDVDRQGAVWWFVPHKHKGTWRGKRREIALDAAAQAVLAPWLEGVAEGEYVFSPKRNAAAIDQERDARRSAPKYPSEERRRLALRAKRKPPALRERYNHRSLLHAVKRACDRAEVAPFNSYSLRHLRGSEVRASHGLEAARAILGQSAISMTDHYSQSADRELQERVASQPK